MTYFVTGATGFIGRHLLERLVERKGTIHCLVRKESLAKLDELRERLGIDDKRLVAVVGDLSKPGLGVTPATRRALAGKVKHFFHLAALYDLAADEESQVVANVEGTRHALELADALKAGCFHHVSSIAAAGLYPGVFREDMFDEAEELDHPYFLHQAREREAWCASEYPAAPGPHVPAGASWWATRAPARRTRSTARTTSSSLIQRMRESAAAVDAERSAWRAGASTWCRSTSWSPPRSTTSRTSASLDGHSFHLADPAPRPRGRGARTCSRVPAHAPQDERCSPGRAHVGLHSRRA
jgi:hypothetical protein